MENNYSKPEEEERSVFDSQEEDVYRDYCAKVAWVAHGSLSFIKISRYLRAKLMENAESYLAGLISQDDYNDTIRTLKSDRLAYRNAIELYMLAIPRSST